jgi:hypothetical protein
VTELDRIFIQQAIALAQKSVSAPGWWRWDQSRLRGGGAPARGRRDCRNLGPPARSGTAAGLMDQCAIRRDFSRARVEASTFVPRAEPARLVVARPGRARESSRRDRPPWANWWRWAWTRRRGGGRPVRGRRGRRDVGPHACTRRGTRADGWSPSRRIFPCARRDVAFCAPCVKVEGVVLWNSGVV